MNYKLESTKNYELFDLYHINRAVDKNSKHYADLLQSMKDHGFIPACPVHCERIGKKLKIKQGHHRFTCAVDLGLPVFYVISNDSASIHDLEKPNTPWNKNDYLASYSKTGNENYLAVKAYMDKTGIGLSAAASMFFGDAAGSGNCFKRDAFEDGNFQVRTVVHAQTVGDIVIFLKKIGIKWADNRAFVTALSRVLFVKEFKTSQFKEKSKKYPFLYTQRRGYLEYTAMIEEIYNYHTPSKDKLNISFMAQQVADKRAAVKKKHK